MPKLMALSIPPAVASVWEPKAREIFTQHGAKLIGIGLDIDGASRKLEYLVDDTTAPTIKQALTDAGFQHAEI